MSETSKSNQDLRAELNQLREDLQSVRGDVSSLVDSMKAAGRQQASDLGEAALNDLRERLEQFEQTYGRAQQRGRKAYGDLEGCIRDRPVMSVGCALGAGLILGILMHRR